MLITATIVALFIIGLKATTEEGMIFEKPYNWLLLKGIKLNKQAVYVQKWWFRILIGCRLCMSSFWGTLGYVYFMGYNSNIVGWIVFLVLVLGLLNLYDKLLYNDKESK